MIFWYDEWLLCLLHCSNLLTEPVCLNDLKTEFLFIALSNDGESQDSRESREMLLREVIFGDTNFHNLKEPLLAGRQQLIHVGCIGEH